MKKIIVMMLMLASVFFVACNDDGNDKEPLNPEKAKVEITSAVSDMSTHINDFNSTEGIEIMDVITNLPDPFSLKKSDARTSVIPNMKRFLMPLNPSKTKNSFKTEGNFDFEYWWGTYTWDNEHSMWIPVFDDPSSTADDKIVIIFPSDSSHMDVNDAIITIHDYAEVLITETYETRTYTYYNPTIFKADLYVKEIKLAEIDLSATWKTTGENAGEPTDFDISVYLVPFTFTGTFEQAGKTANIEYIINYKGAKIFGVGLDATFEDTNMDDPITIKGYLQFASVKLQADVDIKDLEAVIDSANTYENDEALLAAMNAEITAAIYVDGAKAADIEIGLKTTSGTNELPVDILFVYSDGSSESALPYFEEFRDDLKDFFKELDDYFGDW